MSELKEILNEQMKNPEFKKEWDDIQPEMDVIRVMVETIREEMATPIEDCISEEDVKW